MTTRILITGSRDWLCHDLAESVVARLLRRYGPEIVIVHGACEGVDASFAAACAELGVPDEPHPADWRRLGRKAGPVRNAEMVALGAELAIALHPDLANSKGTGGCVKLCLAAGIPVWLIRDETGVPVKVEG